MSNKTDGKKALEAGDYLTAEQKILKALDNHPDDSELWWSMMLIKSGFKNDAELASAVRDRFAAAAENGGGVPETPFDTNYCRNALRYEEGGRKRTFIKNLYAELNAIWLAARGKKLKAPIPREKKIPDVASIFTAVEYAVVFLMVIGVWLVCYALLTYKTWALWTGFALVVVFALAAFILLRVLKKVGGGTGSVTVVLFTAIVLSALALLIVGVYCGYALITVMAGVVLAIAAAFGLYKLFARRRARFSGEEETKNGNRPTRDPYELTRRANKNKTVKSSGGPLGKEVKDEYKDEFD